MPANFTRRLTAAAAIATTIAIVTMAGPAAQAMPRTAEAGVAADSVSVSGYTPPSGVTNPCPAATSDQAGCALLISTPSTTGSATASTRRAAASAATTTPPTGFAPADLQNAYDFQSATGGSGQTVAVVVPYSDPDLASDLATYRNEYGLAPCTVADGCLSIVNESGGTTLPGTAAGFNAQAAESTQMISAICPNCHILVVEAASAGMIDLGPAENEAVTLGAKFIDNPWIIPESPSDPTYDTDYFDHPGVAIAAAAGDSGYGTIYYPAASQYVTAVGGTTLTSDSSSSPRQWDETAWAGSGGGCSQYDPKPSWQTDTDCANRTLNDMAAVADPNTPVAYYDTPTQDGWGTASGTAVAAAIVAAAYALAGTPGSSDYPAEYPYEHPGGDYTTPGNAYPYATGLNNITSGSDGTCSVTYLCTAGDGYNGPTGLGTPNGTTALTASGGQTGTFYGALADICVDDFHGGTTSGTIIDGDDCNGTASQQWTAEPDGTIQLQTGTGDCLSITDADTAAGSPVELATCGTADQAMIWIPEYNGNLYNPSSGLCLYDPDGSVPYTQLEINTCSTSRTVEWYTPYTQPAATGTITSQVKTDICLDDYHSGTADGTEIDINDCNGTDAQQWSIEPDGTLQVLGGCLAPASTTAGADAEWTTCTGAEDQHWILRSDGSIQNYFYNLYLTDPGAATANGTQLTADTYTGDPDQLWNVPS